MKVKVLFLGLLLVAASCKKHRLKQPTDVLFKMDINRNYSTSGNLVFNGGTIWLSSFDVEGARQEGDPIAFSKTFPSGLAVSFSQNGISELDFDIPQGVYTDLDVSFESRANAAGKSLTVNGIYTNSVGTDIPVLFEFLSAETFEIEGEDAVGSTTIVLDKDVPMNSLIELDPIYWFDIVPSNMMENATLSNVSGTMTIVINETVNEDIYDLLADRIDKSTEAIFN